MRGLVYMMKSSISSLSHCRSVFTLWYSSRCF